jgi:hypothetical protein
MIPKSEVKKMRQKTIIIAGIVVILLGIGVYIYNFPYQKQQAEKIFEEYSYKQGLTIKDIKEKWFQKDFKQNGYIIRVIYKDDLKNIYEYHFVPSYSDKKTYKKMFLLVFKKTGSGTNSFKHRPIKEDSSIYTTE